MAPITKLRTKKTVFLLRTYGKPAAAARGRAESVRAVNDLFARNMQERLLQHSASGDGGGGGFSFPEDSFDRLRRGVDFDAVNLVHRTPRNCSSDSDASRREPPARRGRARRPKASENSVPAVVLMHREAAAEGVRRLEEASMVLPRKRRLPKAQDVEVVTQPATPPSQRVDKSLSIVVERRAPNILFDVTPSFLNVEPRRHKVYNSTPLRGGGPSPAVPDISLSMLEESHQAIRDWDSRPPEPRSFDFYIPFEESMREFIRTEVEPFRKCTVGVVSKSLEERPTPTTTTTTNTTMRRASRTSKICKKYAQTNDSLNTVKKMLKNNALLNRIATKECCQPLSIRLPKLNLPATVTTRETRLLKVNLTNMTDMTDRVSAGDIEVSATSAVLPNKTVSFDEDAVAVVTKDVPPDEPKFAVPAVLRKTSTAKRSTARPEDRVSLTPGKWRRSMVQARQSRRSMGDNPELSFTGDTPVRGSCRPRCSVKIVPLEEASRRQRRTTILLDYASNVQKNGEQQHLEEEVRRLSLSTRYPRTTALSVVTAREVVLKRCGQTEPLPFTKCYPEKLLKNCQKIGEGVYGEVFLYKNPNGGTTVMKVIPIEGDQIVNDERQKKFDEILSEIVIAMELSDLRHNKKNCTNGFSEVQNVRCVKGCYPDRLLDLWGLYEENKGTENDCPDMFGQDQLYIVLELANGGQDLETFQFGNAQQAYAMFRQVALSLATAEAQLRFEHRDLHWGNVLLSAAAGGDNKQQTFRLEGREHRVDTHGVEVAIIDFTLSRIEHDGCVIFIDLSEDPDLFAGDGDYQFEVYREMQKKNENRWDHFEPHTNVLWLRYILDKATSSGLRYKNTRSKVHQQCLAKMRQLKEAIGAYGSAKEFVLSADF